MIEPEGTLDVSWRQVTTALANYVARQNATFLEEQDHPADLILASDAIRRVHDQVAKAAHKPIRLVLLGPIGSGKCLLATCYHRHSARRNGPYVAVNCGTLAKELIFAQLFGSAPGAFTGCPPRGLVGDIERADGGTLFLDEVDKMPLNVQSALLSFLSNKSFTPLGGERKEADVLIVCATSRSLPQAMERGDFLEDLWWRLNGLVVNVPPLKERPADVVAFLHRYSLREGTERALGELFSEDAWTLLREWTWRGNFRELGRLCTQLEMLHGASPAGSVNAAVCRGILTSLQARAPEDPPRASPSAPLPVDGQTIATLALQLFMDQHGQPPALWNDCLRYIEKYQKPVFVAYTLGLQEITSLAGLRFKELSARLQCDAATVKTHLQRYLDLRGVARLRTSADPT